MHPLEEVDGTQDKSTNGTQSTVKILVSCLLAFAS